MTALACAFHWSEEFILVWLPLARAEQYYHALLRRQNWRTYPPAESAATQMELLAEAPPMPFEPAADLEEIWKRFEEKG